MRSQTGPTTARRRGRALAWQTLRCPRRTCRAIFQTPEMPAQDMQGHPPRARGTRAGRAGPSSARPKCLRRTCRATLRSPRYPRRMCRAILRIPEMPAQDVKDYLLHAPGTRAGRAELSYRCRGACAGHAWLSSARTKYPRRIFRAPLRAPEVSKQDMQGHPENARGDRAGCAGLPSARPRYPRRTCNTTLRMPEMSTQDMQDYHTDADIPAQDMPGSLPLARDAHAERAEILSAHSRSLRRICRFTLRILRYPRRMCRATLRTPEIPAQDMQGHPSRARGADARRVTPRRSDANAAAAPSTRHGDRTLPVQ